MGRPKTLAERALDLTRGVRGVPPAPEDVENRAVTRTPQDKARPQKPFVSPYKGFDPDKAQRVPLPISSAAGFEGETELDPVDRPPEWAPYHHPQKQRRVRSPYAGGRDKRVDGRIDLYGPEDRS
jgi:hypothetical protein